MQGMADEITRALTALVGLRLSIARRAGAMRIFHFGDVKQLNSGSLGEYALHLQCGWRIESSDGLITGVSDVWEPVDEARRFDPEWDYQRDGNLQDEKIGAWLAGYDSRTRSHVDFGESLVVEHVAGDDCGGAVVVLSGGFRLVLFPDGTRGEHWRFFNPRCDDPHFVVTADGIE